MGKAVKVRSNQMGTILRICNDVFVAVWHSGHASSERISLFFRRSFLWGDYHARKPKEDVDFANGGDFPKPFPVRIHGG